MSHHSDDAMLVASSDSFWEPGNYKRTTKRIDDGFRLCTELLQLIQERSDIEKGYAKSLKTWSKKWHELIEKGPEYGTTEAAWKGVLQEAERQGDLHIKIKDRLTAEVQSQIKQWQKEAYHKSMIQLKEKKEMDDAFKKAQKAWAKLLAKVNKAKAEYHNACKNEKSAVTQDRNANSDTSVSLDQQKKLQDRVQRCKEEVQKTKERYEGALQELNNYNARYMEDMTQVFDKCQEMEDRRLRFFKEMLFGIQGCLDVSNDPTLAQIYEEYRHTIQNADSSKDLKWWSNNHGVGMAMNWPQFEDYQEEFRDISGRSKRNQPQVDGTITLLNQRVVTDDFAETGPEGPTRKVKGESNSKTNSLGNNKHESNNKDNKGKENRGSTVSSNGRREGNPFEDDQDEWDEFPNDTLVDNGEPGVSVKALYDYEGAEADELTFRQGDVFEKLEDEDEQGWCKGRKDGRVGLYPANYVEAAP